MERETSGTRSKYPPTFVRSPLEPPSTGCAASFWKCTKRMTPATFLTLYTTLSVVSCVTYIKTDKSTLTFSRMVGSQATDKHWMPR